MILFIAAYLLVINLIGLFFMRSDKARAKRGKYRVPERRLFTTAILGGSVGVFAGMRLYRHKTKHASFYIGIPAVMIAQLVLLGYVWGKVLGG